MCTRLPKAMRVGVAVHDREVLPLLGVEDRDVQHLARQQHLLGGVMMR